MPFWSGNTLETELERLRIIEPFDVNLIDCAAYTLRMGREAYITPDYQVKRRSAHTKIRLEEGQDFSIPPGQFAFLLTEERLHIPDNILGFISLRTTYKFKGLTNVSGFHVDPGFQGHLVYAVYNAGPSQIYFTRGTPLFLIWFAELDHSASAKRALNRSAITEISPGLVTDISGEILSLQSLSREIKELRDAWHHLKVVFGVILTLVPIVGLGVMVIRFWDKIEQFITGH